MKSIRLLDRRVGFSLASIGLLLGIVAPAALPAFATADTITSRSITMSSGAANASSVSYDVQFTAATAIDGTTDPGGVVVEFCTSPLIDTTCTAPAGLDTTGVSVSGVKFGGVSKANGTATAKNTHTAVSWATAADFAGGTTLEFVLGGIHNPTAAGTFYARIITYANGTNQGGYTDGTTLGTAADTGAVALSTSDSVGVTAYVLESMTFCVSKGDVGHTGALTANSTQAAPSQNCGSGESSCPSSAGCVIAPSFTLGQVSGSVTSLDATHVSTGEVYAQLSTNASGGAIVNLKSDAAGCGGLYRNGVSDAAHCNIAPQTTGGASTLIAGVSDFGVTVGSSSAAALPNAGGAGTGTGTLQAAGSYDATHAYVDAATDNSTGVTSTYGSPLLTTNGTQTSNLNIPVTFNAGINSTTPAGIYGATFNMIATGTF